MPAPTEAPRFYPDGAATLLYPTPCVSDVWESFLERAAELKDTDSPATGADLTYEFTKSSTGRCPTVRASRRAGGPAAHARIARDLREILLLSRVDATRATAPLPCLTGRSQQRVIFKGLEMAAELAISRQGDSVQD